MPLTRQDVSQAWARFMPAMIRGVQLDFFVKKGVTQTQFLILMAIHGGGEWTMGRLARIFHVSMPTVSGIVDRLAHAGYLRRRSGTADRRQVVVELTAKGRGFIEQFETVMRRRWEDVLRSLTLRDLQAFHDVVVKLRSHLQRVEG